MNLDELPPIVDAFGVPYRPGDFLIYPGMYADRTCLSVAQVEEVNYVEEKYGGKWNARLTVRSIQASPFEGSPGWMPSTKLSTFMFPSRGIIIQMGQVPPGVREMIRNVKPKE